MMFLFFSNAKAISWQNQSSSQFFCLHPSSEPSSKMTNTSLAFSM